jgi:hypothetical protein
VTEPATFVEDYAQALEAYLRSPSEAGLMRAEELGRRALADSSGILAVVELHHEIIATPPLQELAESRGRASVEFLLQTLVALDVASQGFVAVRQRLAVERDHVRQLQTLAEWSPTFLTTLQVDQQIGVLAAAARELFAGSEAATGLDAGRGLRWSEPIPAEAREAVGKLDGGAVLVSHSWMDGGRAVHWLGAAIPFATSPSGSGLHLGGLVAVWRRDSSYSSFDEALLIQLAEAAAAGIVNARLYQAEREIAVTLQRNLLPLPVTHLPTVEVGAAYRPASLTAGVGGDWYDLIEFRDGRIGLIVGDVMGHGLLAAAVMGQLRVAVRAYAVQGQAPAEVLERTDVLYGDIADDRIATVVYVIVAPDGMVEWANAGHPPPIILEDQSARVLREGLSPPLGVGKVGVARLGCRTQMEPGSTLVLYTDGMLEHRSRSVDEGIELLATHLTQAATSVQVLCDRAIEQVVGEDNRDDVCILAVRSMRA